MDMEKLTLEFIMNSISATGTFLLGISAAAVCGGGALLLGYNTFEIYCKIRLFAPNRILEQAFLSLYF
jgi:hypothetical protein